jgi:hypothetical protein
MPNIGPNHKKNKFFSPVLKSPNHTGLLYVKKTHPRLGHAWVPLSSLELWQISVLSGLELWQVSVLSGLELSLLRALKFYIKIM